MDPIPQLLHYHFMQNAYLAGTLVAVAAGVMGYFVVLRGQGFAAHSFANVGFAGATGATLLGVPPVAGLLGGGLVAASAVHWLGTGVRHTARTDSAIGAVFTVSLALGYLFLHLTKAQFGASVYSMLFGNVLGISNDDVWVSLFLSTGIVGGLAWLGRPLLFSSADPLSAEAKGVPVRALSLAFLGLLAMMVAAAVTMVGVLLIFSLLITPAATARSLTARPAASIALSVALAVAITWAGLAAGYYTPWPVSFYIVTFAFATYVLVRLGLWAEHLRTVPERNDVSSR